MRLRCCVLIALLIPLTAQAKAPTLTYLFPAGGGVGQTVEITATGSFDRWPASVWISGTGVSASPLKEKGKFRVTIASDATPGMRWLRLFDSEGVTTPRPFVIGSVVEISEAEPNDDLKKTQVITKLPVTVNGRLGRRNDVDGFSIALKRGQTLVADLEANRTLASPMDAVLQVANARGIVLEQNDDNAGSDPRLTFTAPLDGSYFVRVFAFPATPDSTIAFAGGDTYIYRLTLTTGGFLDYAFPFTVGRDCSCRVEAMGTNIPDEARLIPVGEALREDEAIAIFHKSLAGVSATRRVAISAAEEAEPNDSTRPQLVPFPVSLSGRIAKAGDRDCYRVHLAKGVSVNMRIDSYEFSLPLDGVLRVTDPAGKAVLEIDDSNRERDPHGKFTAAAEGDYLVEVSDLNDRGGQRFAYLLTIESPTPDFALTVASDRTDAKPGTTATVAVTVDRKDGDSRSILVSAESLPDGVTCKTITSKPGTDTAKTVKLELKLDDCVCPGAFRIVGRAEGTGASQAHAAHAVVAGFTTKIQDLWLNTGTAPPAPPEAPKSKKK